MTPKPYNVVLDDESFKGEIKIGLKFIPNVSIHNMNESLKKSVLYFDSHNDVCLFRFVCRRSSGKSGEELL